MKHLRKIQLFIFIQLLFSGSLALATISGLEVAGGSRYEDEDDGATTPTLFGGLAGTTADCQDGDTSGTTVGCNNCIPSTYPADQLLRIPCNPSRIFNDQVVTFTFTSTTAGSAIITDKEGNNSLALVASVPVSAGEEVSVSTTWQEICEIDGVSDCEAVPEDDLLNNSILVGVDSNGDNDLADSEDDATQINFRVYNPVSTNTTSEDCADTTEYGVCSFEIGPGDEKVYLNDISVAESFPTVRGGIDIVKVRIMYSADSFDGTTPTERFVDIDIVNTDQLETDVVRGDLDNETNYAFAYASIDSAGNVAHFMDDSLFTAACNFGISDPVASQSTGDIEACPYTGRPNEVVGLLKEDLSCFIATVAFGSPFHKYLNRLRLFRNRFLLDKSWGRALVDYYYKLGPAYAKFINNKPLLKSATRWALYPALGFATLSLKFGMVWATVIYLLGLATLFSFLFIGFKKFKKRGALSIG